MLRCENGYHLSVTPPVLEPMAPLKNPAGRLQEFIDAWRENPHDHTDLIVENASDIKLKQLDVSSPLSFVRIEVSEEMAEKVQLNNQLSLREFNNAAPVLEPYPL